MWRNSQSIPTYRWHDSIPQRPKNSIQHLLDTMNSFSNVAEYKVLSKYHYSIHITTEWFSDLLIILFLRKRQKRKWNRKKEMRGFQLQVNSQIFPFCQEGKKT
jgi:hypothetical protein